MAVDQSDIGESAAVRPFDVSASHVQVSMSAHHPQQHMAASTTDPKSLPRSWTRSVKDVQIAVL